MNAPTTESAVLVAARQLADEARERSWRRRVPGPGRTGSGRPARRSAAQETLGRTTAQGPLL